MSPQALQALFLLACVVGLPILALVCHFAGEVEPRSLRARRAARRSRQVRA